MDIHSNRLESLIARKSGHKFRFCEPWHEYGCACARGQCAALPAPQHAHHNGAHSAFEKHFRRIARGALGLHRNLKPHDFLAQQSNPRLQFLDRQQRQILPDVVRHFGARFVIVEKRHSCPVPACLCCPIADAIRFLSQIGALFGFINANLRWPDAPLLSRRPARFAAKPVRRNKSFVSQAIFSRPRKAMCACPPAV
jgi:hypothetical protein